MDYLNEGIHLRGIAQTDPLVAWQREGFEMFGKLMDSIDDDYLRYVMHVQVIAAAARGSRLRPGGLRGRRRPRRRPRGGAGALSSARLPSDAGLAPAGADRGPAPPAGRARRRPAGAIEVGARRDAHSARGRREQRPGGARRSAPTARGDRSRPQALGSSAAHRPRSVATSRAGVAAGASSRSATARAERSWLE